MDTIVVKLQREPGKHHSALLRVPVILLTWAGIDPWSEVTIHVEGSRLVIEALEADIDLMDMYAEEFVADHRASLRRLGDELCPSTG